MEYQDMGYSGNDLNRPAFIQMNTAIGLGEIDTVVIRSIDRIARDSRLADEWIDGLKARGVNLVTVNGGYNPDFSPSALAKQMKAAFFGRREKAEGLVTKL
jgi:DNA invertase Pin-like site-specific DNA recombinase